MRHSISRSPDLLYILESNLGELERNGQIGGFSSPNQIKQLKCTQNIHDLVGGFNPFENH